MLYEQDDPKGILRTFFLLLLTSLSAFTQVKKMSFGNLNHPSFTKDHQILLTSQRLQRGRAGIKQDMSSSSSTLAIAVKQYCCIPPSQTEMFSCPTLEKVSPGIAIVLTAEEHNCLLQQVLYPSASQHTYDKDSHELCKIGRTVLKV